MAPGAAWGARGFVGIAFRVQKDLETYDAFYLRPTNGRADDQERRNHSAQYISLPEWPWFRLRKETPSRYEAYVDLVPGAWTKIKIEVRGDKARLYVHDKEQPTLIVKDVKSGATRAARRALARPWNDRPLPELESDLTPGELGGKATPTAGARDKRSMRSSMSEGHPHPHEHRTELPATDQKDPVCGMSVRPERAAGSVEHAGSTYWFCGSGCIAKFKADPGAYVRGGEPAAKPHASPQGATYTCPMHPEIVRPVPAVAPSAAWLSSHAPSAPSRKTTPSCAT